MLILAIDPGTKQSGVVEYESDSRIVCFSAVVQNDVLLRLFAATPEHAVVIEKVESYGMPVGEDVFETCRVSGRLDEHFKKFGAQIFHIPRSAAKLCLCGSTRAKDANVSCALKDRFGGESKAVGTDKNRGPLYGVKSHAWAALAIAVTYAEGGWKP